MQNGQHRPVWFVKSKLLPWTRTPVTSQGWLVILAAFIGFMAVAWGTVFALERWAGYEGLTVGLGVVAFLAVAIAVERTIAMHTGSGT